MNISGVRGDAPPDNVFKFLNHQRLFLLHLEGSIFRRTFDHSTRRDSKCRQPKCRFSKFRPSVHISPARQIALERE